jgi:hypothetical protein
VFACVSCSQLAKFLITQQPSSRDNLLQPSPRRRHPLLVATKLHIITHHAEPPSLARIAHVSCRCGDEDCWSLPGYNYTASSHIMQSGHRSLALFSSAVAAVMCLPPGRYQVLLCCGVLRASASPAWSLPSSIIMQRLSLAHSASPTWSLPSLQHIKKRAR